MHAPLGAIVAAIVAVGLAACGGDDDNGAEDGATGQNSDLTFSVITRYARGEVTRDEFLDGRAVLTDKGTQGQT
jgi:hypothetical protein